MTGFWRRLIDFVSQGLEPVEREAVLGDLAESGAGGAKALRDLLGLVLRRQAAPWRDWRPWLALTGLAAPISWLLAFNAVPLARSYELYLWIALNYGDFDPATLHETNLTLQHGVPLVAFRSFLLASWAWGSGFALASLSRRTIWVNSSLFFLVLLAGGFWEVSAQPSGVTRSSLLLPPFIQAVFVLLPSVWGLRRGARTDARAGVLTILWGAVFAAGLVFQDWLWWPRPLSWWPRMLPLIAYWPVLYAVTILSLRSGRAHTNISP